MPTADTSIPASRRGRSVLTRLGLESAAGTIATAWTPVRFYSTTDGMSRALITDDQLGVAGANARDKGKRRQGLPTGTVSRVVPLNLNELPLWLSAGFTRTSAGSSPNYTHSFTTGAAPSNTLTLVNNYASSDWAWDMGLALASLRIQAQKADTAARATLQLVGLKDAVGTAAPSGTLASAFAADDVSDWMWKATWDGTVIGDCTEIDVTIEFGVERIQGLSGDEYPTMHHFGDMVSTGNFTLYGTGLAFRTLARANTPKTLVLTAIDPANAARYVTFTFNNAQISVPQRATGGPGQMSGQFSFEASQDASNPAQAIVVANGVASY